MPNKSLPCATVGQEIARSGQSHSALVFLPSFSGTNRSPQPIDSFPYNFLRLALPSILLSLQRFWLLDFNWIITRVLTSCPNSKMAHIKMVTVLRPRFIYSFYLKIMAKKHHCQKTNKTTLGSRRRSTLFSNCRLPHCALWAPARAAQSLTFLRALQTSHNCPPAHPKLR